MVSIDAKLNEDLHKMIQDHFEIEKKGRGIAFSIPFKRWQADNRVEQSPNTTSVKHHCIMTIVDRGKSGDCIKAARLAGSRGGTVIHGHGAGVPVNYYYPLAIEPQKDVVMVLASNDELNPVRERIYKDLELDKPGNGIIFVLPVSHISGLLKRRKG